jgi:hypothetical protein
VNLDNLSFGLTSYADVFANIVQTYIALTLKTNKHSIICFIKTLTFIFVYKKILSDNNRGILKNPSDALGEKGKTHESA